MAKDSTGDFIEDLHKFCASRGIGSPQIFTIIISKNEAQSVCRVVGFPDTCYTFTGKSNVSKVSKYLAASEMLDQIKEKFARIER